jgi:hypothetical protein
MARERNDFNSFVGPKVRKGSTAVDSAALFRAGGKQRIRGRCRGVFAPSQLGKPVPKPPKYRFAGGPVMAGRRGMRQHAAQRGVCRQLNPVAALECRVREVVPAQMELLVASAACTGSRWCLLLVRWCCQTSAPLSVADNRRACHEPLPPALLPGTLPVFRISS